MAKIKRMPTSPSSLTRFTAIGVSRAVLHQRNPREPSLSTQPARCLSVSAIRLSTNTPKETPKTILESPDEDEFDLDGGSPTMDENAPVKPLSANKPAQSAEKSTPAGPARLSLAHCQSKPIPQEITFLPLGSNQVMISRHFASIETPLSLKTRHVILGYSAVKLTDILLQAYCRTHNLPTEPSTLLQTAKNHVESTHKRYIVFSVAWDGAYASKPDGTMAFSGTVCLRHGASGQCATLSLENVIYSKNRLDVAIPPARQNEVANLKKWMRSISAKTGANAHPVLLPMAIDGLPIALSKSLGALLVQDAVGLCKSVFFDHISRVKDMAMPQSLEEFSSALGAMTHQVTDDSEKETTRVHFGTARNTSTEAASSAHAKLVWTTVTRSLKHLGNKLAAEEQMLSGLQGILDVCLVSFTQRAMSNGLTGHCLKLYSCAQRKMLKAESQNPAELMRAMNEFYKAHARTNVAMCPLEDTKLADLEHLVRFNGNRALSFKTLRVSQVFGANVPELDPAAAWRRYMTLFNSEGHALSYALNSFNLRTKLTTLGFLPKALVEAAKPKPAAGAVLREAMQQVRPKSTSYSGAKAFSIAERVSYSAKQDAEMYKQYKAMLFNASRDAREANLLKKYAKFLVLDLETTTIKHNKRIASPFCAANFVVLPGYVDFTGTLTIPAAKLTHRQEMRLPDLSGYDVLVGHNLKFDLLWLWNDPQLVRFFRRGGIIWDTMYAEYLLSGQTRRVGTGIGLNQIAVRYGGTRKLDEVKSLWDQGVDTKDIRYETLRTYLEGDLRNTKIVFEKQLEAALRDNQIEVIRSRMDVVPCTTEMEFNGLKMNRGEGKRQYDVLREEIQDCKRRLKRLIPENVSRLLRPHWNWNSTFVLSAMYWGGSAKIAEQNMLGTPKNISAAVELAVRANAFGGNVRNKYGIPFLKNAGLRTTGRSGEMMDRIRSFVMEKCPDNFRVMLAGGFAEKKPWLYDPSTKRRTEILSREHTEKDEKFPFHAAISALQPDFDAKTDRVLCLAYGVTEASIDSLCESAGVYSEDNVVFFANVRPLLFEFGDHSGRAETLHKNLLRVCFANLDKTDGQWTSEQSKAVLHRVGVTLGQHDDCFTVPCGADEPNHVTFPGKAAEYFPDAMEREKFMKKSKTEKGKMAVGIFALEEFAKKGEPIAKTLLDLRTRSKLLGTYYETDGTGMMSLISDADECIHHELQLCQTSTSRMASSNPNMQNVPKTDDLRKLFISRYGADGVLLETDYSQLEVVVLCALSRDPQMIADILNKVDFHCKRVTLMRPNLSYDEVFRKAKKEKVPEFVELRQKAKIFSFQRQYGAGVNKLSESTGLSVDEIRGLIKNEETTYRKVKEFYRLVEHSVNAWTASLQDASRSTAGNYAYKGEFRALTGTKFTFGQTERSPEMVQRFAAEGRSVEPMAFLSTQLKNYPIQGFAGEIVQVMLGRLWRHFVANGNYGGKAVLTNTVHDCVWVDCHKDVLREVAADVQRILNSVQEVFNAKWPELDIGVPFTTETCVGRTMAGMKDIEKLGDINALK